MQKSFSDTEINSSSSTLHRSRSAERVLQLLDTVISGGAVSLTDAANEANLPASTALRHLRVLTDGGYLIKDDHARYSVGPTFIRIALAAFQSGPYARLTAAAQPELEALSRVTEESTYLAVRDGTEAVYIATVESSRAIRHVGWVGRSVPIEGTAVGEALLSRGGAGLVDSAFHNIGAIESDVAAVVAPVHGPSGVVAALSILGPAERLTGGRLDVASQAVVRAAEATSLALRSTEPAEQ
ncbi:MAG: IclR family transcriptional regulator [Acidimicrobiales bacterium]